MKRCVIIGGAAIENYERARAYLQEDDFVIYCDCGLRHRAGLGRAPDLVIGDFDSEENPQLPVETIVLPNEKDDTDSFFAAKEARRRGFRDFLLLGAAGQRLDHTLGNIGILLALHGQGCRALLLDDYSEMEIVGAAGAEVSDRFPYFSLLAVDGAASEITVTGAKYPLLHARLTAATSLGISNEPLPGQGAKITVGKGRLLLVRVFAG